MELDVRYDPMLQQPMNKAVFGSNTIGVNMNKPNGQRKTLTVDEAARALGISRNSAYVAVRAGEIPSIKLGRRLVIPRVAFERFLESAGGPKAA